MFSFLFTYAVFTVAFCPYLWFSPVTHFVEIIQTMSHYPWTGVNIYFGQQIPATQLPWHYTPVWISITTPLPYLLLFAIGIGVICQQLFARRFLFYTTDWERRNLVFLALFIVPMITVFCLHSTLYDGWRQMYFVYVPFLMIALTGFHFALQVAKQTNLVRAFLIGTGIGFGWITYQIIIYHPYQNVYFNALMQQKEKRTFEWDYWAMSYKGAIEYVLNRDPRDSIKIAFDMFDFATYILPGQARNRIRTTSVAEADYYITVHRMNDSTNVKGMVKMKDITRDNLRLVSVYRPKPL